MSHKLTRYWYRQTWHLYTVILLPFAWLFGLCVKIRRYCYRIGILATNHVDVPVIVVGNITVGGTGKTPFIIWLAALLRAQGYRPGIVTRGVGGKKHKLPYWVKRTDSASEVGDEALLLMQHTSCPVVISIDRTAAAHDLLEHTQCDIVLSDDGLQHYRLGRDIEIALVDGKRRFGNQCLLPAGPLREPLSRLREVDFVITNGANQDDTFSMSLEPLEFIAVRDGTRVQLADFPRQRVHAVAGIGHPEQFFALLRKAGFDVISHVFPDHYLYQAQDLCFSDELPIIMTEKDAVKCSAFANQHCWYLRVCVKINHEFECALLSKLEVLNETTNTVARTAGCYVNDSVQHDDIG